jgi:predicted esterase
VVPPFWAGVKCGEDAPSEEVFRLLFEVSSSSDEFYRLPFPNDIRRKAQTIELSGHPLPNLEIPGVGRPAEDISDMLAQDAGGFGLNSFVYFRFNRNTGFESMGHEHFGIYNIDPSSPRYGDKASAEWRASSAQGRYICRNWLALGPTLGRPLLSGTTYAAIVTTEITDPEGQPAAQDADFTAMLASNRPADPTMGKAWDAYEPLRNYLRDKVIDPRTIAGAAVFTTADPQSRLPGLREVVRAEPEPGVRGLSSKEQDGYVLYTGRLIVPLFQEGVRPFLRPQDGGAIAYDLSGKPLVAEEEEVNFALSVPLGKMPQDGWPVLLYAHGTGGSEMSFVEEGIANRMTQRGVAVIGLEQVMHGARRNLDPEKNSLEEYSPQRLVFNLLSPRAARDNQLQAAADHFQLVRLVERFSELSGSLNVAFHLEKIAFFGHSQGSVGPFLFAVHEPLVRLIVLSGAGGNLLESLLGKRSPFDAGLWMRIAMLDPRVDRYHPFANILQAAFDAVDPLNFAASAFRRDYQDLGYPQRHVFMGYGIGDTFTPERAQSALVKGLGVRQWALPGHEIEYVTALEGLPYTGNPVTGVMVQYEPEDDYDGHFVMFRHPDAIAQTDAFVETFVASGVPTLGK